MTNPDGTKEQTESWKVYLSDHGWAGHEQLRIKEIEKRKPTQAGLFKRMRNAYENATGAIKKPPEVTSLPNLLDGLTDDDQHTVRQFAEVLRTDPENSTIRILRTVIKEAIREHFLTAAPKSKRAKSKARKAV